ncbi:MULTISPECIES: AMP-binding protein [unclassified Legionella]|uniref:AMP-binding protein n=1 Tax=unclassified Legionella TaxID=2622702 RepID=UPI0010560BB2|nr:MULTISPECIES: AMP-binding protein [unclassified Legionella]MDI9818370.1 AMP-binding protein [Legionella sp. PL877]
MEILSNSLNQLLIKNEQQAGDRVYLRQPRGGKWHEFTWRMVMRQARKVARFLHDAGLKRGDHVAIFSKNCAEWFITDFGISLAGMVSVPLFANQHEESIKYVLEHAEIKMVFIGKLDDHQRVRRYIPDELTTVSFDYHDALEASYHWSDILAKEPVEEVAESLPDDKYTIIYSSGTSGKPKGAVYTHEIIANYLTLFPQDIKRIREVDYYHLMSYLPLAHVYERSAIQLGSVTIPCDVSFVESLDKFADNLREVQPTFFTAVPRIWGVFQQKIEQKLPPAKLDFLLKIPLVSSLIKKKIKHQLGLSRCTNSFSGASHLPESILAFFDKLDIKIQEGYGQTENLAYATFSLLDHRRPGYVGTPRLQVEVKLGKDNQLMTKSPCLMKEYYKNKEATEEALTTDGWLNTGDIAELDENNNVKIIGRLSENFKNQKGEFIVPTPIEERFSNYTEIEQLCLVGRELPNNVLVVTLSEKGRNKEKEDIKQELQDNLHRVNSQLASYEKISHIIVAKDGWTPENGFLTPTLKVKRRIVESNYRDLITQAISQHSTIVWE